MELVLSKSAFKQYQDLNSSVRQKIKKKVQALLNNPQTGKKLTGSLSKFRSMRVWPYRIIYSINTKLNRIEVQAILHRQGVYKKK